MSNKNRLASFIVAKWFDCNEEKADAIADTFDTELAELGNDYARMVIDGPSDMHMENAIESIFAYHNEYTLHDYVETYMDYKKDLQ